MTDLLIVAPDDEEGIITMAVRYGRDTRVVDVARGPESVAGLTDLDHIHEIGDSSTHTIAETYQRRPGYREALA